MTEIDSDYSRAAWPPPAITRNERTRVAAPTYALSLSLSLSGSVSRVSRLTRHSISGTLSLSIEENLDRSFSLDPAPGARAALIRDLDEERLRGLVQ